MKKVMAFALLSLVALALGCSNSTTNPRENVTVTTLIAGLEYPTGMWVRGGQVYFTETNGRNTAFGGKVALSVYDTGSHVRRLLVDNPRNSDAVVIDADGDIYLASYHGALPGDFGEVSMVDTATKVETHIVDIPIAAVDMYVDGIEDLYIIGPSDNPSAQSAIVLRNGSYTIVEPLHQGLGRAQCLSKSGAIFYYSDPASIKRFATGIFEVFSSKSAASISFSPTYLFYSDHAGGKVGKINVSTKVVTVLASGLHAPTAVRWDEAQKKLYVLEGGTSAGEFKDGTLKVLTGIR
jgi:hypothetical protein